MSLIHSVKPQGGGRMNGIYLGGKADAKSIEKLQKWRVHHILNVTPAKEASIQAGVPNYFENRRDSKTGKPLFSYHRIPIYDASTAAVDLLARADEIVAFIAKGLHHGSVLVHCAQGISRSTTAVALYLMAKQNMTADQAMKLIQRRRPQACPIPSFLKVLDQYQEEKNLGKVVDRPKSTSKTTHPDSSETDPPSKRPKTSEPTDSVSFSSGSSKKTKAPSSRPAVAAIGPALPPSRSKS